MPRDLQRALQEFVAQALAGGRARAVEFAAGIAQGAFAGFGCLFEHRLALALRVNLSSLPDQLGVAPRGVDLLAQSVERSFASSRWRSASAICALLCSCAARTTGMNPLIPDQNEDGEKQNRRNDLAPDRDSSRALPRSSAPPPESLARA